MAENYYEGMFLLDSTDYASDPDGMSQMLAETVGKAGGTVEAHRPWQEGRLAYEVEGRRKGLHYLVMFTMETGKMTDLQLACRRNDKILRTLFLTHPKILFDATVAAIQPGEEGQEEQEEGAETPAAEKPAAAETAAE